MNAILSFRDNPITTRNKVIIHPGTVRHKISLHQAISNSQKIIVPLSNGFECLRFDEILYLKAQSNYTEVHTSDRKILLSKTLKSMEFQFPKDLFFRVHKSYLINASYVKSYVNSKVESHLILENDTCIPVSKSKKKHFTCTKSQIPNHKLK
jgi:two-component system LytT family response regulator